jgi:Bacterial PH domain
VLTTDRILTRAGVMGRRGSDLRLDQIAGISHHQNLVERVVGTGRLALRQAGTGNIVVFDHVPRPDVVHRLVAEQAALRSGAGVEQRGPGPPARSRHDRGLAPYPAASRPVPAWEATPPAGVAAVSDPPATGHQASPSVAERLVELAELHRRGLVTDAEYSSKRMQLLDQL